MFRRTTTDSTRSRIDGYQDMLLGIVNLVQKQHWQFRHQRSGPIFWANFSPADVVIANLGWKFHLSRSGPEALDLLPKLAHFLLRTQSPFKIPASYLELLAINAGEAGAAQVGKVVTIYTSSDRHLSDIAQKIDRSWRSSKGPHLVSDLLIRGNPRIGLRFGVLSRAVVHQDAVGRHKLMMNDKGSLFEDIRTLTGTQPTIATPLPFIKVEQASRLEPSSKRWQVSAKVQVLASIQNTSSRFVCLCMQLEHPFSTVVAKVARAGVGSCVRGHSSSERLEHEAANLNRIFSVRVPRVLSHIKRAGYSALIIEDLSDGTPLVDMERGLQILSLSNLVKSITKLHEEGFVHRDIKLSNAMCMRDGSIALIDLELADRIDGENSAAAGTHGYFPEGEQHTASIHRDCFALAATIFHTALSRCASTLPYEMGRKVGLLNLHRLPKVAHIVKRLYTDKYADLHKTQLLIPSQDDWNIGYTTGIKKSKNNWIRRAGTSAIHHAINFQTRLGGWRNTHLEPDFIMEGINLGGAGIALGLITIDSVLRRRDSDKSISVAMEWLSDAKIPRESSGLFTGNSGVALALAITGSRFGRQKWINSAKHRFQAALEASGKDNDLFFGDSGILLAGTWLQAITEDHEYINMVNPIGHKLMKSCFQEDGLFVWQKSSVLEEDTRPQLGTAHGASGIALALAHWGDRSRHQKARILAEDVFESLFLYGRTSDGFSLRKHAEDDAAGYPSAWCHGMLGYLWCILHALPHSSRLAPAINWAANRLKDIPAVADPTFCHGLAGRLETVRMLSRTGRHNELFRYEIERVQHALRLLAQRRDGHIYWTSEDPNSFTPDLWVGSTGTAAALCMSTLPTTQALMSLEHLKWLALPVQRKWA